MIRLVLALALSLAAAFAAPAQEIARNDLWPAIPKASGDPHPEGNAWWRRNHMTLLMHDRDLTVHEGERKVQASLKGCFECHAVKDEAGTPVTYEDPQHFCRVCHDFAAVKVDCFTCHRSTPPEEEGAGQAEASLLPWLEGAGATAGATQIEGYLAALEEFRPRGAAMMEAGQ